MNAFRVLFVTLVFSGKYECEVGSTPYSPEHGSRSSERTLRIWPLPLNLYLQISYRFKIRMELGAGREDGLDEAQRDLVG